MTNPAATKDPVCGTDLQALTAAERTEYNLQTYFFCSGKCRESFEQAPHKYAESTPPQSDVSSEK